MKIKLLFSIAIMGLILVGFGDFSSEAIEIGDLSISGNLRNETYVDISDSAHVMSCRNQLTIDFDYAFTGTPIIRRGFIELRPVYDAVFDWENKGTGGGSSRLREHFQDNFGVADDWDPLLRECWADLSIGKLDARLGRQIVSWGKSDGIYLLDMIHPFNWRNSCVFEEEDTKIPLWMVNLEYELNPSNFFQFLFIPRYVPAHNAFDGHDWAANVTTWVEHFDEWLSAPQGPLFSYQGAGATIKVDEPGTSFSNAEYGLRWSGWWKGISYTLNYFYTWDDYLNQYPTGTWSTLYGDGVTWVNTEYTYKADRVSIFGASYDYCWDNFLGVEHLVTRGEFAYFKNDVFCDYDFNNREKDNIGLMLGFDKYYFIDYWFSFQFALNHILNADKAKDAYYDLGSYDFGKGMRDETEIALTFYLMKDYLPGDFLHTEWYLLYDDDGTFWFRPKVKYDFTDQFHVSIGANFFWGNEEDPFAGESHDNDNIFMELNWGF